MLDYKLFDQSRRLVFDVIRKVGRIRPCISSFRYSDKDGRLSNSRRDPGLSNIVHAARFQQWILK